MRLEVVVQDGRSNSDAVHARLQHPQLANRTCLVEPQVQIECGFFCLLTLCFYYCFIDIGSGGMIRSYNHWNRHEILFDVI